MSIATRFSAHTLLSAFTVSGREAGADLAAGTQAGPKSRACWKEAEEN